EIPHDRLVALRKQAEAVELVGGPGADVSCGDVADVPHVEAQQRTQLGSGEQLLDPSQALVAQPVVANPFLPVDTHDAIAVMSHWHRLLQTFARGYSRGWGPSRRCVGGACGAPGRSA